MADFTNPVVSSFNPNFDGQDGDAQMNQYDEHMSITRQEVIDLYTRFVLEFESSGRQRVYRDQLQINYQQRDYSLNVDLSDLHAWSNEKSAQFDMRNYLISNPTMIVPIFETAVQNSLKMMVNDTSVQHIPPFQITLYNYPDVRPIGSLQGRDMNRIVVVQGIIVSALKPQLKAISLKLKCRNCGHQLIERAESMSAYANVPIPNRCPQSGVLQQDQPPCPTGSFEIIGDECQYIDVQELKLQEAPEQVKSGEMPRQIKLSLNRTLVDRVKPGTRVTCIGIYTTASSRRRGGGARDGGNAVSYAIPYLAVMGIYSDSSAAHIVEGLISDQEQEELRALVTNTPNMYERIARSIAPSIMGKEDVKKAIACGLFGGTQKRLPDGMTLRGDINVLLLGDPSVAKSQFLKFSSQVAPISVYTSGKGSSAAGLTAAVVRSQATGEFHLEAGALVLADGGLVCIDEFDKMREQDRVAIHEAMEQQTISIAKAGITTILNSRCSVLAAANPIFGRYDDMKSPTENIDFQSTILSRFDLIFILRDVQEDAMDESLATHIINVHKFGDNQPTQEGSKNNKNSDDHAIQNPTMDAEDHEELIKPDLLKKLIAFSRRLKPRLSTEAKGLLIDKYVHFRDEVRQKRNSGEGESVIPITVRQLEAIIRISESIARMSLREEATREDVQEALRLFQVATIQSSSHSFGADTAAPTPIQVQSCEIHITNRLVTNQSISTRTLLNELRTFSFDEYTCKKAINNLIRRNTLVFQKQRKFLKRIDGNIQP